MAKSQWSFKSATELSAALAAKKLSAVELAQDAIDRIERHDGKINAICVRDFDRGLEAARAADAARARGETRPLLGIPVTVKESYNIAGLPTTWGNPAQKDFMPAEDALSISRVKAAGGVILGKTNVPLSLGDWQSYNEIYGTTNNPFDLGAHPRRLLRRIVGSTGGGLRTAVARLRYRRLAAGAGVSLRRLCPQADLRLGAVARAYAAAAPAAAVRPRPRGDRADGAQRRRPCAVARCDRRTRPAGRRQRLSARAAAAAPRRPEELSRAPDRHRSGHADREKRAHGDRETRRQSRRGRRRP